VERSQKATVPAAGAMSGPLQPARSTAGAIDGEVKSNLGRRADARWDPDQYPVHFGASGHPGQGYDLSHASRSQMVWHPEWMVVLFQPPVALVIPPVPLHDPSSGLMFGPFKPDILVKSVFVRHAVHSASFRRESIVGAIGYGALLAADIHLFGGVTAAVCLGTYFGARLGANGLMRRFNEITHYEDIQPDSEDYTRRLGSLHTRPITTEAMLRIMQCILRANGVVMPARSSAVRWIQENGFTDHAEVEIHLETFEKIKKRYAGAMTPATLLSTIRQFAAFEMGDHVSEKLLQTTCVVAYQELDYVNFLDRASTTLVSTRVPRTDYY